MKRRSALLFAIALAFSEAASADRLDQWEWFEQAYADEGDALLVALSWLPETAGTARSLLPEFESWHGGEDGRWLGVADEARQTLFETLAQHGSLRSRAAVETLLGRVRLWRELSEGLAEIQGKVESPEGFLDAVHAIEALRPVFDPVLAHRPADFDPAFLGSTLSSAEFAAFAPGLILRLMELPESRRIDALRQLFAALGFPDPGVRRTRGGKEPISGSWK